MKNIDRFLDLNADRPGRRTKTQVSATENEHNQTEMADFIEYWKERVDRVRIYPEHSRNGRFGELIQPRSLTENTRKGPCRKLFTDLVIYCDGKAALCNHDWDESLHLSIGSAMDHTIEQIWHSSNYRQLRSRHLENRIEGLLPCEFCDHRVSIDQSKPVIGRLVERPQPYQGAERQTVGSVS